MPQGQRRAWERGEEGVVARVIYLNGTSSAGKSSIARGQYDQVHRHGVYDVEVDTSILTPQACAERILEAQQRLRSSTAFERLRDRMDGQ
jgi:chloramphenicol 3-O phosphotransferase